MKGSNLVLPFIAFIQVANLIRQFQGLSSFLILQGRGCCVVHFTSTQAPKSWKPQKNFTSYFFHGKKSLPFGFLNVCWFGTSPKKTKRMLNNDLLEQNKLSLAAKGVVCSIIRKNICWGKNLRQVVRFFGPKNFTFWRAKVVIYRWTNPNHMGNAWVGPEKKKHLSMRSWDEEMDWIERVFLFEWHKTGFF